jgi:hypothetical protein
MMKAWSVTILLMPLLLTGCGQVAVFGHTIGERGTAAEVKHDAGTPQAKQSVSKPVASAAVHVVKAVALSLTAQTMATTANDSRFNADALNTAIRSELLKRKLLDETNINAETAAISIDALTVQPKSNAVVFGYILSTGKLSGDMQVHLADAADMRTFRLDAETQLSIAANGKDPNPLGPLYRRFAVLVGDSLSGTVSKQDVPSNQNPR